MKFSFVGVILTKSRKHGKNQNESTVGRGSDDCFSDENAKIRISSETGSIL